MKEEIGVCAVIFKKTQLNSIRRIETDVKYHFRCDICGEVFRDMTNLTIHFTNTKCGNSPKQSVIPFKIMRIGLYGKRVKSRKWIEVFLEIDDLDNEIA